MVRKHWFTTNFKRGTARIHQCHAEWRDILVERLKPTDFRSTPTLSTFGPDAGQRDAGQYVQERGGYRIVIQYKVIRLIEIEGQAVIEQAALGTASLRTTDETASRNGRYTVVATMCSNRRHFAFGQHEQIKFFHRHRYPQRVNSRFSNHYHYYFGGNHVRIIYCPTLSPKEVFNRDKDNKGLNLFLTFWECDLIQVRLKP